MMNNTASLRDYPVVVVGAGPVGLAMAAHLVARGVPVQVLEAGDQVGAHWRSLRHVRLFSPWRYNIDSASRTLLEAHGWTAPPLDERPLAGDWLDHYLLALAQTPPLAPYIHCGSRVQAVARAGHDRARAGQRQSAPFVVRFERQGQTQEWLARAVIDASGTGSQPNPMGWHGLPAWGEREHAQHIAYGMPDILGADRARYAGRQVVVLGAGHSAGGNLIALARLAQDDPQTRVVWVVRSQPSERIWGRGQEDGLPARGQLGMQLKSWASRGLWAVHWGAGVQALRVGAQGKLDVVLTGPGLSSDTSFAGEWDGGRPLTTLEAVDEIIVATGYRPDFSWTRELRLQWDPRLESTLALAPWIDPEVHSCGSVPPHGYQELTHPEPDFYVLGAKSYGRAPNFLLAIGYEQARSVAAALAGDWAAARQVQLELPQTGVCHSGDALEGEAPSGGCCGGPPKALVSACCVRDEIEKSQGKVGCGCGHQGLQPA